MTPPRLPAVAATPAGTGRDRAQVAATNKTANAFLGITSKPWMRGVAGAAHTNTTAVTKNTNSAAGSRSLPTSTQSARSDSHKGPAAHAPTKPVSVLPSPTLTNEPSPSTSSAACVSPNPSSTSKPGSVPSDLELRPNGREARVGSVARQLGSSPRESPGMPAGPASRDTRPPSERPVSSTAQDAQQAYQVHPSPVSATAPPVTEVAATGSPGIPPGTSTLLPPVRATPAFSASRKRSTDSLPQGSENPGHTQKRQRSGQRVTNQNGPSARGLEHTPKLRDHAKVLEQRIASMGGLEALSAELDRPRYGYLLDACHRADTVYIMVHQLYCLWSVNRSFTHRLLSPVHPVVVDVAFGHLSHILMPNHLLSEANRSWFSCFPLYPGPVPNWRQTQSDLMQHASHFLSRLSQHWATLLDRVCQRRYPTTAFELVHTLGCSSPILRMTLFTASRRSLAVPDMASGYFKTLYTADEEFETRVTAQDDANVNATRQEMIGKYKLLMNRFVPTGPHAGTSGQQPSPPVSSWIGPLASPPVEHPSMPTPMAPRTPRAPGQTLPASPGLPGHFQEKRNSGEPGGPMRPSPATRPEISVNTSVSAHRHYPTPGTAAHPPHGYTAGPTSLPGSIQAFPGQTLHQNPMQYHAAAGPHSSPPAASNRPQFTQQPVMPPAYSHLPPSHNSLPSNGPPPSAGQQRQSGAARVHNGPNPQSPRNSPLIANTQGYPTGHMLSSQAIRPQQNSHAMPQGPHSPQVNLPGSGVHVGSRNGHLQANVIPGVTHLMKSKWPQVKRIPEYNFPPSQFDWSSFEIGAHLSHLRSPKRPPAKGTSGRHYQHLQGFAVAPTRIDPGYGLRELDFFLSANDMAKLPGRYVSPSGNPTRTYYSGCTRYRLRCCTLPEGAGIREADWAVSETYWPSEIYLSFNKKAISTARRQHFHHDQPAELTDLVTEGHNKVRISLPGNKSNSLRNKSFFMAVEVVMTSSYDDLWSQVVSGVHITSESTRREISRRLKPSDSDDVIVEDNSLCLSLADPFSSVMFKVPVRGESCKHLECFDLENWLSTRCSKAGGRKSDEPCMVDVWKCPICGHDARPTSLRIDDFFVEVQESILTRGQGPSKQIKVMPDGTWTAVIEEEDDVDCDSDGDGPKNASAANGRVPGKAQQPPTIIEIEDD